MSEPTAAKAGTCQHILVLSDSDLLFFIIKANLQQHRWRISRYETTTAGQPGSVGDDSQQPASGSQTECQTQAKNRNADLIIIAHSGYTGEPVVALARAGLTGRVGQVPILIVSERPLADCPAERIFHLDFPFDSIALRQTVHGLLNQTIDQMTLNHERSNQNLDSDKERLR